jgi:putative transposase
MPRRPRLTVAGIPFHIIQRGNNRSACFLSDGDYLRYLTDLGGQAAIRGVAVHAYVLMTNHVHLLATGTTADAVGQLMKFLGQRYVQYINRRYGRTGTLWEGRFRSCLVDADTYLLACHRYIEANPVRAGMVRHPADYRWSSYRANAEGQIDPVVTPHPLLLELAPAPADRRRAYRELFDSVLDEESLGRIRKTTNGGFALGGKQFQQHLADKLKKRVVPGKRGRPWPQGGVKDDQ